MTPRNRQPLCLFVTHLQHKLLLEKGKLQQDRHGDDRELCHLVKPDAVQPQAQVEEADGQAIGHGKGRLLREVDGLVLKHLARRERKAGELVEKAGVAPVITHSLTHSLTHSPCSSWPPAARRT